MFNITATGRLTRDAEIRDAGGNAVCSFSIASNRKVKGEDTTMFLDCSIWGERGKKLQQYLTKGTQVCVQGEFSTREHNGKTYLSARVDHLELMGGGKRDDQSTQSNGNGRTNAPSQNHGGSADMDDVPFVEQW